MFAGPFLDVDIPEVSVWDFLFAEVDQADLGHPGGSAPPTACSRQTCLLTYVS